MGKVIAIDGPSGAGKGTIAKLLAKELGFSYLDTGALYRAVALALREKGIEPDNTDDKILEALKGITVTFKDGRVFLNANSELSPRRVAEGDRTPNSELSYGRDVSEEIRSTEMGHYSSVFSARKVVRDFLLNIQRDAAKDCDLIAEGRDMTTVVFPDAWKKIYIDAAIDERARRRYLQLKGKGIDITDSQARHDVIDRDERDSSRDIAPLKKAEGAFFIDSSSLTVREVLEQILKFVRSGR